MKSLHYLRESFETKERFLQEIHTRYSYSFDKVESIDFRINKRNINDLYEAMQNFEKYLVDEFRKQKKNYCSATQFLDSISDFDKIIFVIITYMKTYFDFCKDYSKTSVNIHIVQFDFTTTILIQGFYNYNNNNLNFSCKLEKEVLDNENELLQERLDLIREELCELIGVDPNLQEKGHDENYIFNLNIDSDNQIGFLLQATGL